MVRLGIVHRHLSSMFSPRDFARWMTGRELPSSALLAEMPPWERLSPASYFDEVGSLLYRHGVLRTHEFYCDLLAARPLWAAAIGELAVMFAVETAVELCRELALRCRHERGSTLVRSNAGSQVTRVHDLEHLLLERSWLSHDDPRRAPVEAEIAAICDTLLFGPRQRRRPEQRAAAALVPASPLVAGAGSAAHGPGVTPAQQPVAPVGSSTFMQELVIGVKAATATFFIGATLLLAGHDLARRLWPASAETPRQEDREQPGPAPPVVAQFGTPPEPALAVPEESAEPSTEHSSQRAIERPSKPQTKSKSKSKAPPIAPTPGPAQIPAPLSRLSLGQVAEGLKPVLAWDDAHGLSMRVAVRPDGKLDMNRLERSTLTHVHADKLAELQFPPTASGSDEVLCYVVDGPPRTMKCRYD
jgi:hypothetical protein